MNFITKYSSDVFQNENIRIFHVTCVLHDCRQSARMEELQIQNKKHSWLSPLEEQKLTEIIRNIVQEKGFIVLAFNICGDHVHMILACEEDELTKIVQCIKSISARTFNIWKGLTVIDSGACSTVKTHGETQNHLWARKFNRKLITTDEQLFNASQYVQQNRKKHGLSRSSKLNQIIYGHTKSF